MHKRPVLVTARSPVWAPIPGLALKLPRGARQIGLLILNVPNVRTPRATITRAALFGLRVNGTVLAPTATFTYNEASPPSTGPHPDHALRPRRR